MADIIQFPQRPEIAPQSVLVLQLEDRLILTIEDNVLEVDTDPTIIATAIRELLDASDTLIALYGQIAPGQSYCDCPRCSQGDVHAPSSPSAENDNFLTCP